MEFSKEEVQTQAHSLLGQKLDDQGIENPKEDKALIRTLKSCCIIPQRYLIGILCSLGIFNGYTMRVCLNMAITQMVNHTKTTIEHYDPEGCPSEDKLTLIKSSNKTLIDKPHAIFDWDEATQGFILSGFYYGYATTQLMGGFLSERFGAKWVLGCGLLSTAVFTFLIPPVTRWGGSNWLFTLRVIQGMGEGPTVPALMTVLSRWIPPGERSFQGALVFGGAHIGNVFGSSMSGILLSGGKDWAIVFYFFGSLAIIWFILWALLSYSTPTSHPFITKKESEYLKAKVKINPDNNVIKDPVPWKAILHSGPVWALVAASVGHDWGYYTLITDLPKYSHDILKFNITSTGYLVALPYASLWLSAFLFGVVCDYCIKKGYHSIKTGRIIHTSIATTGPAVCIILASYAGCNRVVAMTCFVLSMTVMGGFYSGMKVNTLDLAPNYTGTVTAIANTISTMTGIISPYLIGLLTPDSTLVQWRVAFWVCFGVMVFTNIIYCIWADGEQQWWDDVRQHGYPPGWLAKHGPLFNDELTNKEMQNRVDKL